MTIDLLRVQAALGERFRIDREIGRGGMAHVYLAHDTRNDRQVAIKVLKPDLIESSSAERFLREVRVEGRLQHPNILPIYESGNAPPFLYYVMPYIEGESLSVRLRRDGPLDISDAVRIGREAADALAAAHAAGVLHRDVKPDNILLSGGHAVLADFGVARAVIESAGDTLTVSGVVVGTPTYMSPEQGEGRGQIDERSDLYSLGCVLYEMVAGEPPFTGRTAAAVYAKHMAEPVPTLSVVRPGVPPELEAVITRCLAKVPADRFRDARSVAHALDDCSSAITLRTSRPLWTGDHRRRRFGIPAGGVAAAALLGWLGWFVVKPAEPDFDRNRVVVFPAVSRTSDDVDRQGVDVLIGNAIDHAEPLRLVAGWDWLSLEQRSSASGLTQSDYDSISSHLQAGYYITSQVLESTDSITVVLQLYDTKGDTIVHQTSASGALGVATYPTIVFAAIRELLPQMVDPGRPIDLRLLTDRSPTAVAYFVQGERAYRLSRFDEALEAYRLALDEDSLMAFAAMKGAQAASWIADNPQESIELTAHALRLRDALPVRYRLLIEGLHAYQIGAADSAIVALTAALAADPESSETSQLLGEVHYHLLPRRVSMDSAVAHFERAALDPGFTPPLIHLIEHALRQGRVADAKRLQQRLVENSVEDNAEREILDHLKLMSQCVERGPEAVDFVELARNDAFTVYQAAMALAPGAQQVACARAGFEALLTTDAWSSTYSYVAALGLQGLLIAEGRIDEADALLSSILKGAEQGDSPALSAALWAILSTAILNAPAGAPNATLLKRAEQGAREQLGAMYERIDGMRYAWIFGILHAYEGDEETVARLTDFLLGIASQPEHPEAAGARMRGAALSAQLQLMRGDTTGALAALDALRIVARRDEVGNDPSASFAPERLLLAQLHLARRNFRAAHDVAATFDHQETMVNLAYVPMSLRIRYEAARELGDAALAERYLARLRILGRHDLVTAR